MTNPLLFGEFVLAISTVITETIWSDLNFRVETSVSAPPGGACRTGYPQRMIAPVKVLVVDDDPTIRDGVEAALKLEGYDVLVASDGTEGVLRAELEHPNIILLDVLMPRRSGYSLLDRLAGQIGRPRLIVMTGSDTDRHKALALARGADAFLPKPFEMESLLKIVAEQVTESQRSPTRPPKYVAASNRTNPPKPAIGGLVNTR